MRRFGNPQPSRELVGAAGAAPVPALALDPRRVPGPRSCRFLRSPPPCAPGLPPGSFVRGQFPASASRSCVRHCLGFISSFLLALGWPLAAISSSRAAWHRDAIGAPSCQLCGDAAPQNPPQGQGAALLLAPSCSAGRTPAGFTSHVSECTLTEVFWRAAPGHGQRSSALLFARPTAPPAQLGHLFQVTDG